MNMKWVLLMLLFSCVLMVLNAPRSLAQQDPVSESQPYYDDSDPSLWGQLKRFFDEENGNDMIDEELQGYMNERYGEGDPDHPQNKMGPGCSITAEELEKFFEQYDMM